MWWCGGANAGAAAGVTCARVLCKRVLRSPTERPLGRSCCVCSASRLARANPCLRAWPRKQRCCATRGIDARHRARCCVPCCAPGKQAAGAAAGMLQPAHLAHVQVVTSSQRLGCDARQRLDGRQRRRLRLQRLRSADDDLRAAGGRRRPAGSGRPLGGQPGAPSTPAREHLLLTPGAWGRWRQAQQQRSRAWAAQLRSHLGTQPLSLQGLAHAEPAARDAAQAAAQACACGAYRSWAQRLARATRAGRPLTALTCAIAGPAAAMRGRALLHLHPGLALTRARDALLAPPSIVTMCSLDWSAARGGGGGK